MRILLPIAACTALLAAVPASAGSLNKDRSFTQNGSGTCAAALPAFEGLIRKRPLAIQNEATANAFVSCSLVGTLDGVGGEQGIQQVVVTLINNGASAASVTCTLVNGVAGFYTPTFFPKTVSIPAGGVADLGWIRSENNNTGFRWAANVQCALPPETGVGNTYSAWVEVDEI